MRVIHIYLYDSIWSDGSQCIQIKPIKYMKNVLFYILKRFHKNLSHIILEFNLTKLSHNKKINKIDALLVQKYFTYIFNYVLLN